MDWAHDLKCVVFRLKLERCSACNCQLKLLHGEPLTPHEDYPDQYRWPVCEDCMRQIVAAGNLPRSDVPNRIWKMLNNAGGWRIYQRLHPRRRSLPVWVLKGQCVNFKLLQDHYAVR